jgi:uncharacterized membrane protein
MTFTFTAVVKATAAKFNFAACSRHAKCSFRVRLHTKYFYIFYIYLIVFLEWRIKLFQMKLISIFQLVVKSPTDYYSNVPNQRNGHMKD